MSSKIEEKKAQILAIFHETGETFTIKELEKLASKNKGISAMAVKDLIQKLLDDDLVQCEKHGTTNIYWSFPSKALHQKKRKFEEISTKHELTSKRLKLMQELCENTADVNENLTKLLQDITGLELDLSTLKKELQECKENDPAEMERMKKHTEELKDAANRWTDNIFAVKTWCKKKFNVEDTILNKQLGIPEDLDYV